MHHYGFWKTMVKPLCALGLTLSLGLGMAACTQNQPTETTTQPTEAATTQPEAQQSGFSVTVTVPQDFEGELNGRCLIAFAEDTSEAQPYEQIDLYGVPVFGKTVYGLTAGDTITFTPQDAEIIGFPFTLSELPAQDFSVQAFFITYTQFTRSNGSTIWGMADQGGGGDFHVNPGNYYSDVVETSVDVSGQQEISLTLNQMIPMPELEEGQVAQQGNYEDTDMVKYVKIKSQLLTDFWGQDIYIGANVLLPHDYDPNKEYPTLYYQGHFPGGSAPLSYGANEEFTAWWDSGKAPQMVVVTIRDANMYYDTSYSVDSENLGPWGDAIHQELIPYLEETFHLIDESWARLLSGGSTGGWESLALQVFYPDFYGGAWSLCPDSVSFEHYQVVNLYEDENAYYLDQGWFQVARPGSVALDGNVKYAMKDENLYEAAVGGLQCQSLGQWAIWEAVYGPMGEDGYPERVYDPMTGVINKDVVAYWGEHYDLTKYLQNNWSEIGESLVGKLHIRGGDMDAYYLNQAQYVLGDWLETTTEPYYDGYCITFPRKGHTGNITNQELLTEMAEHMMKYGPDNVSDILFG